MMTGQAPSGGSGKLIGFPTQQQFDDDDIGVDVSWDDQMESAFAGSNLEHLAELLATAPDPRSSNAIRLRAHIHMRLNLRENSLRRLRAKKSGG